MAIERFYGRERELSELKNYCKKRSASLIVVKGRRRIGKSRLVEEFAKNLPYYKFTGLAPEEGVTAQDQRDAFMTQLSEQTGLPEQSYEDWSKIFTLLALNVQNGRKIIFFDEVAWMAHDDPTFIPKLKNLWDDQLSKNPKLILILCSSVSTWIEDNILNSTALFGRISWSLNLEPLPLVHCNELLESLGFKTSNYEKFKVLSITGGIPWYLEQIQGEYTADKNIQRLCFRKGGLLVNEFHKIFHELFEKRDGVYKKIVASLTTGPKSYDDIAKAINYPKSGRLSDYIDHLVQAGFISKDSTWSLKTGIESKLAQYRLADNYIRFYLKYIAPKQTAIEAGRMDNIDIAKLPGWDSILGLQFENLVLSNRQDIYQLLNITPESIIFDNPFLQRATSRQKGCQIDYAIQTQQKTLYVFEIKFSRKEVPYKIIDEVNTKIKNISLPRGIAVLPILIHVNGVADSVIDENYFYRIIDFSELLN